MARTSAGATVESTMPVPLPPGAADAPDLHADPRILADSIAHLTGAPTMLRSTHMSWVVLSGDRVFKLKRPVALDFVDLRSAAARAASCRHELALNAELAPGLEIAIRTVLPGPDGAYRLGDDGDPRAIDHVIEMRRFDETRSMRSLLARGELTLGQAAEVGVRLARFHRSTDRAPEPVDERARFDVNADALLELVREHPAATRDVLAAKRFAAAFLTAWSDVLDARFAAGRVVDGHGDVRTEHVLFDHDPVRIVDRLDLDALRYLDVADELAFLAMDLEAHGGVDHVPSVLAGYAQAGGTLPPTVLLAYYAAYRALVRTKVALLPGAQDGTRAAQRLLPLARRSRWRARGPLLLLVTGPPASGKSTLAAAIGEGSGLPVVSSDATRRRGPADYGDAARAAVYRTLARQIAPGASAVVDATFGEPRLRSAFLDEIGRAGGASRSRRRVRRPG